MLRQTSATFKFVPPYPTYTHTNKTATYHVPHLLVLWVHVHGACDWLHRVHDRGEHRLLLHAHHISRRRRVGGVCGGGAGVDSPSAPIHGVRLVHGSLEGTKCIGQPPTQLGAWLSPLIALFTVFVASKASLSCGIGYNSGSMIWGVGHYLAFPLCFADKQ